MEYFAGLDVSLETVNVCIVNGAGDILLEKKIAAEPAAIVHLLKSFGSPFKRIGLEAGPTSSWLYGELRAAGYRAICLEYRHVKAGLSAMRNKTDRNDARGIAQLVRLGWFRQVHVKSEEAQRTRMLLVNRQQLLTKALDIENSVRGSLKVFGLPVGVVARRGFEARVLELVADDPILLAVTEPMLRVRQALFEEFERLDRLCQQLARRDPVCRRLMTVPGVGVVVALTYRTGVDAPERFSKCAMLERISASPRNATVLVRLTMTAASVVAVTRWSAQPCIRQRTFCCIMADGHRSDPGPCGSRREAA